MKETELAQMFVDYLSGYDLYFEVDFYRSVDIVALKNNISAAFEVKTSFNFKVLEQAIANREHFNYSYIAVPEFGDSYFKIKMCKDYGLGLLVYRDKYDYGSAGKVSEYVNPKLNRISNKLLRSRLSEKNKQSLPGSKSGVGTKITAFGVTVESLKRYVERNQGCLLKEAIEAITHHYSSCTVARSCIARYIHEDVIKGLELNKGKLYIK